MNKLRKAEEKLIAAIAILLLTLKQVQKEIAAKISMV